MTKTKRKRCVMPMKAANGTTNQPDVSCQEMWKSGEIKVTKTGQRCVNMRITLWMGDGKGKVTAKP